MSIFLTAHRFLQVLKVAILAEKYATDYKWYVDVILNLIRLAGDYVSEEVGSTQIIKTFPLDFKYLFFIMIINTIIRFDQGIRGGRILPAGGPTPTPPRPPLVG